ncbi:MAG: alkaline phosphatase family protein [Flavobacteriales bacterium]|nr:alkaline phosphatase family protein [Flavobacteriales bacterium]
MKKGVLGIIAMLFMTVGFSQYNRPKLVVGIVVDQMRYDYIYRYWNQLSDDGFKRFEKQGTICDNAYYNYMPTYTGPGHASVYTGTTPRVHGIIGNNWYDKVNDNEIYCVADPSENPVGSTYERGKISPRNMLTTTIGDQLKIASQGRSKVIGVAIKDRGSVLPAGHMADGAFWYDITNGKWVSSTFYMSELPQWVKDLNEKNLADQYLNGSWKLLKAKDQYTVSLKDERSKYEGKFEGSINTSLPYNLKELRATNENWDLLKHTPFGNTYTKDIALAAIKGAGIGKDDDPDLLTISFSSTDAVGHKFGPNSVEVQDTYLRLDQDMAEIFKTLDTEVGEEQYLVFLTADHAVAQIPQYMMDNKVPSGYYKGEEVKEELEQFLDEKYGKKDWIKNYSNFQFFLNKEVIPIDDYETVVKDLIHVLLKQEGVHNAIRGEDLMLGHFNEGNLGLAQSGYNQKRSGDIVIILEAGWMERGPTGTTHGSPYAYDTHVPLYWYGKTIPKGKRVKERVEITDIARTVSDILSVQEPNGCQGDIIKFE